jgi:hypothetical protein
VLLFERCQVEIVSVSKPSANDACIASQDVRPSYFNPKTNSIRNVISFVRIWTSNATFAGGALTFMNVIDGENHFVEEIVSIQTVLKTERIDFSSVL